jgi:dethiobiotin synthetase
MKHSYFVTGTDTEIGKTLVSAALIYKLNQLQQHSASGYKPVVAGTYINSDGRTCNEDIETYLIAQGNQIAREEICPYIIDFPAAPHLVASEKGITLDLHRMLACYEALQKKVPYVISEGAGGFLTPIDQRFDLSDFAVKINIPIVLTVGLRLGCLNHALLTVEAIEKRGLHIAGWVANCITQEMPYQAENIQTLCDRIKAPLLGIIPYLDQQFHKKNNSPYTIEAIRFAAAAIKLPNT